MRKFATKFISRQNSVNQYFVFCLAYFVFCLAYLVFWLKNLVFVWCTWCLVYVVFCLAYIIYFWRTWCIFWRNWCLWHWDVVFLTFLNWDGASNIFITKNVQIYVFIPWINFPKSSSYRVLCGKRYASLKKVHHPRLWGLWQLSGVANCIFFGNQSQDIRLTQGQSTDRIKHTAAAIVGHLFESCTLLPQKDLTPVSGVQDSD